MTRPAQAGRPAHIHKTMQHHPFYTLVPQITVANRPTMMPALLLPHRSKGAHPCHLLPRLAVVHSRAQHKPDDGGANAWLLNSYQPFCVFPAHNGRICGKNRTLR